VPVWLGWYGDPYRVLVRKALQGEVKAPVARTRRLLLGRIVRRLDDRGLSGETKVEEREAGIHVRLAREPLPNVRLPRLSLPQELTYRERQAIEYPGGGRGYNLARPEDRATLIPDLDADPTGR
jgi:hypothetical protein